MINYTKEELISYCLDETFKNNNIKYLHLREDYGLEGQSLFLKIDTKNKILKVLKIGPFQDNSRNNFLNQLLVTTINEYKLDLDCNIIVSTGEHAINDNPYTQLCFSSYSDTNHILIPDPHIFQQIHFRNDDIKNDIPFEQKEDKIVFFGSDTGSPYKDRPVNQRILFCYNSLNHPKIIAKITNFVCFTEKVLSFQNINSLTISSPYVPINIQLKYKYILNIDGNSSSWDRIPWAMASNSYLIHLKSDLNFNYNWYYPFIIKHGILPTFTEQEILDGKPQFDPIIKEKQKALSKLILDTDVHIEYFARVLIKYNNLYNGK